MRTIKITPNELKEQGIKRTDLILIDKLVLYGFNTKIINNMIRFDILPDVLFFEGAYYVRKVEIFGIVEKFLENTMSMYATVEDNENKLAESLDYIEANKIKLSPEDIAKLEAGEISVEELLTPAPVSIDTPAPEYPIS